MKWTRLLCIFLLLVLLTGCTEGGGTQTLPSATVPQTVSTEPSSVETVPAVTEPVLEAVNILSARELSADVCILDHRTAAFLSTEYISGDVGKTVTHVTVLDLYTDEILAQKDFDQALALPLQTSCPGALPLFEIASQTCTVYDAGLRQVFQFQAPDRGGVFSEDMATYYYISAQRLYRMDTGTAEAEQIVTDLALPLESIADYDSSRGRILVNVHTQYYLTELCIGVIDLQTGAFTVLSQEADSAGFWKNGTALEARRPELRTFNLILHNELTSDTLLLENILKDDTSTSSWHISGSDYLISLLYESSGAMDYRGCTLYRIGDAYESCDLGALLGKLEPNRMLTLPDGNLLGLARSRRNTVPVLILTEQLSFTGVGAAREEEFLTVDTSIAESYAEQARPVEVAPELLEVRAQADALEEKYGITILMSNQCQAPIANCSTSLVTTDQAQLKDEADSIGDALRELNEACKLYPADFFRQFRNEAQERGVLVLLVQDIGAGLSAEGYDILGVSFQMDDWYPIAVDVTTSDMTATFCHELWHATENKINSVSPTLLSEVTWYRYNPDGFSYTNNGGGTWGLDSKDTFLGGYGTESYFVDGYAKTSSHEDRARLMEYVITSNYYSRKLMAAPALHLKMEVMSNAIRAVFDTADWKNVRWERDL